MTRVIVDVSLRQGESLTQKIGQIIAMPEIRARQESGILHTLRGMRTMPHSKLSNYYTIEFEYEPCEEAAA